MAKKIKCALIGFGGMGHFHSAQYAKQKYVELVAICDSDPASFKEKEAEINLGKSGESDLGNVKFFTSYEEMVSSVEFDMLDICLPCPLHAEYAIRAMKDGYHVLCEKPMARTSADAAKMIETSAKTGKKLMIAQCLRFANNVRKIKEMYDSGKYGKLLRLDMRRNGGLPKKVWYRDPAQSGGALLDLHLHDTDFIQYLLGAPEKVMTFGIERTTGGIDDLMSNYVYASGGPKVISEGSWCRGAWYSSTVAVFEKATVDFCDEGVRVCPVDGKEKIIKVPASPNPYFNEIAYFSECIVKNKDVEVCTPESTRLSIVIAEAEEKSARTGKMVTVKK